MVIHEKSTQTLPDKAKKTIFWLFLLPIVMVALVAALINLWSLNTLKQKNYVRAEITQQYFILLLETAQLGQEMADIHLLATDSLKKAVEGVVDEGELYQIHSLLVDGLADLGEKTRLLAVRSEVANWAHADAQIMVDDFASYRNFMIMATDIAAIAPQTAKLHIDKARDLFMDMVKRRQAISTILTENAQQQNLANKHSMAKIFKEVMGVSGSGLLVMLLVSIFLSQLLSRWMSQIANALQLLAQIRKTAPALPEIEKMQKKGVGEFKKMAGAVLAFRQAIQERYVAETELKSYKDSLEELVTERTMELTITAERLQQAQKIAHLGSWEWHVSNNKIFWSEETYHIYGLNPDEKQIDYATFLNMVHIDDREAIMQVVKKTLNSHSEFYSMEHRILRPDGSLRFLHGQGELFLDESGKPYKMLGTVLDITDRKDIEQNLIEAKEYAESATQAKGEFLANMSHEIRTPMNAITGFTEIVLETELSPKQTDYLNKIQQSASSLLGIINDILDFSKIEAGVLQLEEVNFRPATLINNLSSIFSSLANDKGLNLVFDLDDDLPKALLGDPGRLNQVLVNLTSNAFKFTEQGEVKISIKALEHNNSTVRVQFSVRDSGIGIEKDTLGK
ncbi:PAS domain-containing protein, partial [bacterium]|nr:PAS domain-containing protein [bacterium]